MKLKDINEGAAEIPRGRPSTTPDYAQFIYLLNAIVAIGDQDKIKAALDKLQTLEPAELVGYMNRAEPGQVHIRNFIKTKPSRIMQIAAVTQKFGPQFAEAVIDTLMDYNHVDPEHDADGDLYYDSGEDEVTC